MCLAVPAQLIAVNDVIGTVELTGATRDCSLLLITRSKGRGLVVSPCRFCCTNCWMKKRHKKH